MDRERNPGFSLRSPSIQTPFFSLYHRPNPEKKSADVEAQKKELMELSPIMMQNRERREKEQGVDLKTSPGPVH